MLVFVVVVVVVVVCMYLYIYYYYIAMAPAALLSFNLAIGPRGDNVIMFKNLIRTNRAPSCLAMP